MKRFEYKTLTTAFTYDENNLNAVASDWELVSITNIRLQTGVPGFIYTFKRELP